ncbi:MAG: hypothetical protein ABIP12_07445 [Terriglobales bacterium]
MNYLLPAEFESYGLDASTPEPWVAAASAMIDSHCRRSTLGVAQYVERQRLSHGRNTVQLTYLPLAAVLPATTPIASARARYAPTSSRYGEGLSDMALDVAQSFSLAGSWTMLDAATVDFEKDNGSLALPPNSLGFQYNEVEITYNAGLDPLPDEVKFACAQIVKNAQATPAFNVRAEQLDSMRLEYFADGLLDASVRTMLAPYVAQRLG